MGEASREAPSPDRVHFEGSQPILRVENMQASLRFYVDLLGFTNAPWGDDNFTSVTRDQAGIYLCRGHQGRGGAWVWIGVEDAEKLHEELKSRGRDHPPAADLPLLGARDANRRS